MFCIMAFDFFFFLTSKANLLKSTRDTTLVHMMYMRTRKDSIKIYKVRDIKKGKSTKLETSRKALIEIHSLRDLRKQSYPSLSSHNH